MVSHKDINKKAIILVSEKVMYVGQTNYSVKKVWRNFGQTIISILDNGDILLRDAQGRTLQTERKNVRAIDDH